MLISEAEVEDEWLLAPGSKLQIGKIKPEVLTHRSKELELNIDEEQDVENQL